MHNFYHVIICKLVYVLNSELYKMKLDTFLSISGLKDLEAKYNVVSILSMVGSVEDNNVDYCT